MPETYSSLFHRHVAASFDKQLHLVDLVGELNWSFQKSTGLLSFGDHYHWHVSILGTEAYDSNTWLWAWANAASNLPAELLQAPLAMKDLGQRQQIAEFTTAQLPLDEINGHLLSLIASGVCNANGYYRGPYTGGTAFFIIQDENFPKRDTLPLARIPLVFPQVISALEIQNHKLAFLGYLQHYGLTGVEEGDRVVVMDAGQPVLTAAFDKQNRLTQLEGTIEAET
jgi:hypothetical protein